MTLLKKPNSRTQLIKLANKYGTPLFIISRSKLVKEATRFRALLPRVTPFYAAKANSHPEILKVFAEAKLGFDVASKPEIESVLGLGISPTRLIFANTVKRPEALSFAKSKGISLMTFDAEYELNKIAKYCPGARVLARIKVPNVGSLVELSVKFGVDPSDAIPLLIKAVKLGLKAVGVSFHVGSQCTQIENYLEAFEMASIIVRDARLKQLPLEIVDIGGGFPIRHFDDDKDIFEQMAPRLNKEMNRLFDSSIQIIAEPGRVLVGPAGTLIMRVIGKSIRANKHWYYLDDGVYGALSGIVYDHCKYQYKVFRRGHPQISTLAGPTCDSFDIISLSEDLPELEFGDIVYVDNIGAYSIASSTEFNSIPKAKVIAVD
jgi:ornithine decarboxylase